MYNSLSQENTYVPDTTSGRVLRISALNHSFIAFGFGSCPSLISKYEIISDTLGLNLSHLVVVGKYFAPSLRVSEFPVTKSRTFGHMPTILFKDSQSTCRWSAGNSSSASMQRNTVLKHTRDFAITSRRSGSLSFRAPTPLFDFSKAVCISSGTGSSGPTACLKSAPSNSVGDSSYGGWESE